MSQMDTVVLVVNETSSEGAEGDLERIVSNLAGVQSAELDRPGIGGLAREVRITYDPRATTPQALRADLEGMGYTVTAAHDTTY